MESQISIEELSFGKSTMNFLYQVEKKKDMNIYRDESLPGLISISGFLYHLMTQLIMTFCWHFVNLHLALFYRACLEV